MNKLESTDFSWHKQQPDIPQKTAEEMKEFLDAPVEKLMDKTNELIGDLYGDGEKAGVISDVRHELSDKIEGLSEKLYGDNEGNAGEISKIYDEITAKRIFLQNEIVELSKDVGKNFEDIRALENADMALSGDIAQTKSELELKFGMGISQLETRAEILSEEIAMTGERKQDKLTAGENISITDDVISGMEGIRIIRDANVDIRELNGLYRAEDMVHLWVPDNETEETYEAEILYSSDFILAVNAVVYIFRNDEIACYTPRSDLGYDRKTIRTAEEIRSELEPKIEEIGSIAKGRAAGYVFDTEGDMESWLADDENVGQLNLGDNLYIREISVPDYWWDGGQPQQLETQKVDLSNYVKNTDYATGTTMGLVRAQDGFGIYITNGGTGSYNGLRIRRADQTNIDNPTEPDENKCNVYKYRPIVPANLDYAVVRALTNPQQGENRTQAEWTKAEQTAARKTLGISDGDIISAVMAHSWTETEIRKILDNMVDQSLANKIKKLLDWLS